MKSLVQNSKLFTSIVSLLILLAIILSITLLSTNIYGATSVDYQISNDWGSGAVISIKINNLDSSDINGWTISWTFPENQKITSMWNASFSQSGNAVTAFNVNWNSNIPANGSVNFGFQLTYSGSNSIPGSFIVNQEQQSTPQVTLQQTPQSTTTAPTATPGLSGNVTYTLAKETNPTQEQQEAYRLITEAMDKAISYYNQYTSITKQLYVTYNPSVSTADGNINGSIRFGKTQYMNYITAMHEISHTVGVGTTSKWGTFIQNGIYTGINATNMLRQITGDNSAEIHGDSQHFWPYGLNYTSEVQSESDVINHCRIVNSMKQDGL